MRPKPKKPKIRINLVVRQSVRDQVERLKELTSADTMTEVIRRALDVYETLINDADGPILLPEARAEPRALDPEQ